MNEELICAIDAAKVLKVSPRTIERWRSNSSGPPFIRLGRRVWYRRQRLAEFILSRETA